MVTWNIFLKWQCFVLLCVCMCSHVSAAATFLGRAATVPYPAEGQLALLLWSLHPAGRRRCAAALWGWRGRVPRDHGPCRNGDQTSSRSKTPEGFTRLGHQPFHLQPTVDVSSRLQYTGVQATRKFPQQWATEPACGSQSIINHKPQSWKTGSQQGRDTRVLPAARGKRESFLGKRERAQPISIRSVFPVFTPRRSRRSWFCRCPVRDGVRRATSPIVAQEWPYRSQRTYPCQ